MECGNSLELWALSTVTVLDLPVICQNFLKKIGAIPLGLRVFGGVHLL